MRRVSLSWLNWLSFLPSFFFLLCFSLLRLTTENRVAFLFLFVFPFRSSSFPYFLLYSYIHFSLFNSEEDTMRWSNLIYSLRMNSMPQFQSMRQTRSISLLPYLANTATIGRHGAHYSILQSSVLIGANPWMPKLYTLND